MGKTKTLLGIIVFCISLAFMPAFAFADTYYTVKPGDSLWKIARSYNTTVSKIKTLNTLNSDMIYPGQSLRVGLNSSVLRPEKPQAPEISRGTSRTGAIIEYAKSFIGVPYRGGGESPRGFDCSGFVKYIFSSFGIYLPRTAGEQFYSGRGVSAQEAMPGDIVAFRTGKTITHSGIYLGGGKFISSTSSHGIAVSSIHDPYWCNHFLGFSRILP